MKFGASMFFTDYAISADALAVALEERGFDSVWAPEHSHIPLSRKTAFPAGGELPRKYAEAMDPFVSLTAAAAVTRALKVGTGVCLVAQRDPIQLAKTVASLDVISGGRFLFGIGNGWNQDEMENHGCGFETRHKRARENVEAMRAIWGTSPAEYHGAFVDFDPMIARPQPVRPPPVYVGGAFPYSARRAIRYGDGWLPQAARRGAYRQIADMIPEFHRMCEEAGRGRLPVTVWHSRRDVEMIKRYEDLGVERVVFSLEPESRDEIMPKIDAIAAFMRGVTG
jgi:probable F420-dependent oxidoreductase